LRSLVAVQALYLQSTLVTNLEGLGPVIFQPGGIFVVENNALLETLGDFTGLMPELDKLSISSNPRLRDVAGLDSLKRSGGMLIADNDELTSMHGLEGLTAMWNLQLDSNPKLASLNALQSLESLGYLSATRNSQLPTCEIRALSARVGVLSATIEGNNDLASCQ